MHRSAFFLIVTALAAHPAFAWDNHALGTSIALEALVDAAPPVRVETLESFLAAEGAGVAAVLDSEEAWARANVPSYPQRPGALAYRAGENRAAFLAAIRVNPNVPMGLFLQEIPGRTYPQRPKLAHTTSSGASRQGSGAHSNSTWTVG
jgi:hypothetical protein